MYSNYIPVYLIKNEKNNKKRNKIFIKDVIKPYKKN